MKNLYKILTVMFVFASVSLSFAADKDYRKSNSTVSKQTSQKADAQKNKLPDVIQEILLDSIPVDDSSVALGTDDAESADGRFFTNSFIQSNDATPFSQRLSFARMGANDGIELNAGQKSSGISFTLPIDKVIISAKLELYITMTEMLKDKNIHLAVKVNGQPLGTLPIMNTELTDFEISVPAEFLSQNNSISVEIDDDEFVCKVDYSGSYKIKVDSASYIAVEGYNLELGTDLSLFPLPFYDRYNLDDAKINFVLPKGMSKDTLKAALMMASYFGSIADYRAVSFNVVYDTLPQDNSIVFAHPKQIIAGIEMPEKSGVYIKGHPYSSPYKNIYVIGADEEELIRAVYTLVNARTDTNTDYLALGSTLPPERKAYDAPNWIPSDRKVYLSELLRKNQSLVTHGYWHSALNLSFKAAPDLYQMYEDSGDLYIAYEFPLDKNIDETVSGLNLSLSGNFIEKLPVYKKGLLENIWRLSGGDAREDRRHVLIPPNIIYGDNNLEMYFDLRLKPGTPCSVISDPNVKSVIDESSYLDLSKTRHFSKLPNLSYFVGASFPFSRYADFSKTAILIPEEPTASEMNTLMSMAARAGNSTGSMIYGENVYTGTDEFIKDPGLLDDKDLLIVANLSNTEYLSQLFEGSPFFFNGKELNIYDYGLISFRGGFFRGLKRLFSGDIRSENVDANRYVRTSLAWRGFLSFLSPFDSDRTAVLVTATDDSELERLTSDLRDSKVNREVGGDITLISGSSKVVSFNVGDYVFSGNVSTAFKILTFAGEHVVWLCISSFIVLILLSFIISKYLHRRAKARLFEDGYTVDSKDRR